ncbi:hypothetical protein A9199_05795 [Donghicola sp. JL3646]|nr:hypothetical protein BSK21_02750 [Marivivens sp. JLT3646]OBR36861.1 hypothetical protein A9199_05795 [Donghicola sp. JL3646]
MVGSSKILTVSYGTFACTLEGFDDSFDTMKAIAEYFRDLAADDRYFGAEPPTPDAEMLARIAENEIARRVEARMESSGIVLRAAALAASENRAAEPVVEEPQAVAPSVAPVMPPPVETPEVVEKVAPQPAPAPAMSESVAAKLQRIRAVVGKSSTGESDYIEDIHAAEPEEDFDLGSVIDATEEAPAQVAPMDVSIAETEVTFDDPEDTLGEDAPAAEPVAQQSAPVADVASPREAAPLRRTRVIRLKRSEFNRALNNGTIEAVADKADEDVVAAALAATPTEEPVDEVQNWADTTTANDYDETYNDADVVEASIMAKLAAAEVDANEAEANQFDLASLDGADDIDFDADSSLSDEEEADLLRELSALDDDEDDYDADEVESQNAFVMEDDYEDEDEEPVADARADQRARALLDREPEADERDMSRIMDRTDEQLRAPETDLRRRTLSHLKAAVAATEAARRMGEPVKSKEDEETDFRSDLSAVVRPTRPTAGGVLPRRAERGNDQPRTERPRPAPLKLVAAQRVDLAPEEAAPARPVAPVRPRRVATESVSSIDARDSESFADYVEEMGAHSLPDLLEAAAAYTSFVEGHEEFSRPHVMKKVREVLQDDDFNREDGLRVFGTLLREGRISKVRNGRFQVSEGTRFRPEPRAARG